MRPKQQLEEKYPEIFENCFDFSINDGWLPIVETLVESIAGDIKYLHEEFNRAVKFAPEQEYWAKRKEEVGAELVKLTEHPPRVVQVKEKFGGLRFYMDGGLERYRQWIRFAENLSYEVCEYCGRRATHALTRWIKNVCEEHAVEKASKYADRPGYVLKSKYADQSE